MTPCIPTTIVGKKFFLPKNFGVQMDSIRLFIIEDQPTILKNQVRSLRTFKDITIIGTAMSGEEAIRELQHINPSPHVILCDLGLPKMNGIETIRQIKFFNNAIEILVFTVFEDENKVMDAIKAGASGYILKGTEIQKIHDVIVDTYYGGTTIQPHLARKLLKYFSAPQKEDPPALLRYSCHKKTDKIKEPLTIREIECLQIIAKGLSNQEAAEVLNVSLATIRTHLEHIYQKLDASNRVEAVTEGIRYGLIEL